MIKKIGIVSLSSGILGEEFIKFEADLGVKRLKQLGLEVVFLDHALKGIDYLRENPQARAQDLITAFKAPTIDMILCAIGGDDTHRLLPYLFDHNELQQALQQKIFLGFSDTTMNHLMLHKLGLKTFYGQAFLPDICELDQEMLPYSFHYFKELLETGRISEIRPSAIWYEERTDFSPKVLGTSRMMHKNEDFELLKGSPQFEGAILGGCLESLYQIFDSSRYEDSSTLCQRYQLFPSLSDWQGKILLLETSEEKPEPALYRTMLETLKITGIFEVLNGVIVGKPMDETYYDDYKRILLEVIDTDISILYNINVGHATPRAIIPLGVPAKVDAAASVIRFQS